MKSFSIQEVERYCSIKAHTLWAWEARYGILTPTRVAGNCRHYSIADLEKVFFLILLTKNGYRISKLALLSVAELQRRIQRLADDEEQQQYTVYLLMIHMFQLQIDAFKEVLERSFSSWSVPDCLLKVLLPFLEKTGLLFLGNQRVEEHFAVTAIRKKLMSDDTTSPGENVSNITVLLFLSDTKQLDLGLLLMNNYLKCRGVRVLYMGNDVSINNLISFFDTNQPDYIYTYGPLKKQVPIADFKRLLQNRVPSVKLFFTLYPCDNQIYTYNDTIEQLPFLHALNRLCTIG